jgi:hypothetical protein
MPASIFQSILNKVTVKEQEKESRAWFRNQAKAVSEVNEATLKNSQTVSSSVKIGYMYLFQYDPKHKTDLPYYDKLPLVFPFDVDSTGFTAINFHYLDLKSRAQLMDYLYNIASSKEFDEKTKLNITYSILKRLCKVPYYKACTKKYLTKHVKSRYILIPSNEWDTALFLPLERFAKKSKNIVFNDSKKIIAGQ